MLSYRTS